MLLCRFYTFSHKNQAITLGFLFCLLAQLCGHGLQIRASVETYPSDRAYFKNIYNLTKKRRTPPITKANQYFLYSKIKPNCFWLFENLIIKPIKTNTAGTKIHLNFSYIIIIILFYLTYCFKKIYY